MNKREATKIIDHLRKEAANEHTALSEKLEAYRNTLIRMLTKYTDK